MTEFLKRVCASCPRKWSFEQLLFEIEEYRIRNKVAHSGIEEWVEAAKEEGKESDKWKNVAQYILRDREMVKEGTCPAHLSENQARVYESLMIYEDYHFEKLVSGVDPITTKDSPQIVVPASRLFPTAPKADDEEDTTVRERILAFEPYCEFEILLKQQYENAYNRSLETEQAVKNSHIDAAIAAKTHHKATLARKDLEDTFRNYERRLKNYPRER
jgi:hypothetical protein